MSRAERRQYQRMMKGVDRTPGLPPAARARAERVRARREAARQPRSYEFSLRFWIAALAIAVAVGLVAFSLQWPNMPLAAYIGLSGAAVALVAVVGIRFLQRRSAGG